MPPEFADVSVIMPAYRAAATIGRALASIAAQTVRPREAIVVDDGSDDGTYEAALGLAGNMSGVQVKVYRQHHQGASVARNTALMEATRRYVAFLDADDEWLPEKLERSLEHLEGTDNVLVAHNYYRRDLDGTETIVDCAKRFSRGADPYVSLYERGYMPTCAVVARRADVLDAGGFDTSLEIGQDFELWLALLKKPGTPFLVFGDALSRYHIQRISITGRTGKRLECCLRIAGQYAPELRSHPGTSLFSLWFRIAAVHGEAFTAHRSRGHLGKALGVVVKFPSSLLTLTAGAMFGRERPRQRFIPSR